MVVPSLVGTTRACLALLAVCGAPASALRAQGDDPIFVLSGASYAGPDDGAVLRFDRSLILHAAVSAQDGELANPFGTIYGVCTDGLRRLWVPESSGSPHILRIDAAGQLIDSVPMSQAATSLIAGSNGDVYALIGSWTGAVALDADGIELWSTPFGGSYYWYGGPVKPCLAADGSLWFGGTGSCGFIGEYPAIAEVGTLDGAFHGTWVFPGYQSCQGGPVGQLAADRDGSMWAWTTGSSATGYKPALVKTDGSGVLQTVVHDSKQYGSYGVPYLRIDGQGRVLSSVYSGCYCVDWCTCWGTEIRRHDPAAPSATAVYDLGGYVHGFTLGPTGEEVFAETSEQWGSAPSPARLVRLNLVTGARSTAPLPPDWPYFAVPHGDPTGFVFANTVDRTGDLDGDGAANGAETAAGSNPFDPESRPDGPKVYVSFAPDTNAIAMTLFDPDGLRHPTKGIDFGTMTVTVGSSGNVFWPLLGLVTEASLSADGTSAHVVFGGLPLASDLKLRVEMTVRDRTGAIGWDWQATPPGDL